MALLLRLFVLLLLVGCGLQPSATIDSPHATQQIKLPEFVDKPEYGVNEDLSAPRQKLIYRRNGAAMDEILKNDAAVVHEEMVKRLAPTQPMSLRLVAAATLVLTNDEEGKKFFIAQSKIPQNVGDLYVTLNYLAWTATPAGSYPDLSWAEDLMIEALQNRTRVVRRDVLHFPEHIRWQDETVELRELAVQYGSFGDHLVRMCSQKALPVILSLLREKRFYGLNTAIGHFGCYKDDRVRALLLELLNNYRVSKPEDSYRFAVAAAADMGLTAAIPSLMRHLDDADSYYGLRTLGDVSLVPRIRAALPRLTSYAHAEAELTMIRLQGGDVLPSLIQLLKRQDYLLRDDVIIWLKDLKDPRSVPAMTSMLCHDPDWFVRWGSIQVLGAVRTKEAIKGLVEGLGCDYSKLHRPKTNDDYDYNGEYRGEIAKALQEITSQNFGTDQKRWTQWLEK